MAGVFATPRPMPDQRLPFIAGAAVIVLALPIFLAAGWDLRGWVIGATLWAASRALAALLTHLRSGMGNLAGSGVVGFGMTFRALAVMVVVVVLAATDARLALAVVLLYALAYTLELAVSLALYFSGRRPVKRLSALALTLFLLLPQIALASSADGAEEEKFNPEHDFDPGEWIPIHLGPLDLSINKTVAYLILGTIVTIFLGLFLMRARIGPKNEVGRRQAVGEMIYDIAQTQVAEQGLPHKAIARWFPYVTSLMLFIWVINMLGFIPLPLSNEKFDFFGVELPTLAIYAATSSISVTLALALMTWIFTHFEGIRYNGTRKYFRSWIPDVPKAILPLIVPLEILGQFMRLISLSVRLYANMLAGHMLILTFIGLIFVLESLAVAVVAVPAAAAFYLFEVVIVVSIQAFIFAALSAIYIGSAIEPEH